MRLICLMFLPWFIGNCDIMIAESNAVLKQYNAESYLKAHNNVRNVIGIPSLEWDRELAKFAKSWTMKLAEDCYMEHSSGSGYGENLAQNWGSKVLSADEVVGMWVSEREYYDYDTNSCDEGRVCGHYTQVVWANTKKVGCAYTVCKDDTKYPISAIYACEYYPPGNYVGQRPY